MKILNSITFTNATDVPPIVIPTPEQTNQLQTVTFSNFQMLDEASMIKVVDDFAYLNDFCVALCFRFKTSVFRSTQLHPSRVWRPEIASTMQSCCLTTLNSQLQITMHKWWEIYLLFPNELLVGGSEGGGRRRMVRRLVKEMPMEAD